MTDERLQVALQPIPARECLTLLRGSRVGRLAIVIDGKPHVVPVNFAVDESGVVVFRTADVGVANEVALAHVAFEVDHIDPEGRSGWSVVVHGFGREIGDATDPESTRLRELSVETWAGGPRGRWYKISPREITGRRLAAHPSQDR